MFLHGIMGVDRGESWGGVLFEDKSFRKERGCQSWEWDKHSITASLNTVVNTVYQK